VSQENVEIVMGLYAASGTELLASARNDET
jgi:hypothetical protein